MFLRVLRRGFCVNNNDPIHTRNYQNSQKKALWEKFNENDETQVLGNFQEKFHDPQYIEQN